MQDMIEVREWDADQFHAKVREWEEQGYTARHDTYQIKAETDPDTGKIVHLYTIEMSKD